MTRSIVTGAAGFVGSHLVDKLLAQGHSVTGIDCFTDYYDPEAKRSNIEDALKNDAYTLLDQDLCTLDLDRLLEDADVVFHLAGQAGVRPSWGARFSEYERNNISATQRLLEAAKNAHLGKFIFASSSSVYGNAKQLPVTELALPQPVSPYGVTKLAAEHLCTLYGELFRLPVVSLRLFTVYGPRQRPDMAIRAFLNAALSNKEITIFGDGEQTRDFTFVDDVVSAFQLAMEAPAGQSVYNVCGGSEISLKGLLQIIERTTGGPLRIEYTASAQGDARHTLGDNTLARNALGFAPAMSLEEGVAAEWQWLQEHSP